MAKRKHDHHIQTLIPDYPVTVADICEWAGIPTSTMHDIIRRLEQEQCVKVANRGQRPKPIRIVASGEAV